MRKSKENGWLCIECNNVFRTRNELKNHLKEIHNYTSSTKNKQTKVFCKFCGKMSTTSPGLKTHEKYCKNNPNKIDCVGHSMKQFAKKISDTSKRNGISGGIRPGTGSGKKGTYKGFKCSSSWELAFVIWCLDNKKNLRRNLEAFEYEFKGEKHKYYPDFILDNQYYEIKGRRPGNYDEKNNAKFKFFPYNLIILDSEKIQFYLQYVIQKYGKDFIKLYE